MLLTRATAAAAPRVFSRLLPRTSWAASRAPAAAAAAAAAAPAAAAAAAVTRQQRTMWLFSAWRSAAVPPELLAADLWSLAAKDPEGKEVPLKDFKGKVLLITNTATKCGFTQQHLKQFHDLKQKFGDQGFEILAFPTLQFKQQEEKDPQKMCEVYKSFNANFPIFAITEVNGPNANPIFQYCKFNTDELYSKGQLQAIGWNFGKFLLDRNGKVFKYFGPRQSPAEMEEDILLLLRGEAHGKQRNKEGVLQ
ncbi:glutathione/thioredoxin peroxidase, putative [Eimeria necatrix]|uniref:Glutathione peroxidase n=1 Tax=Eimeria necatrix TaxID=51315 RepID=U6MYT5_9EIME|nr:glutathione/thioredoxin peroxidase, putative [Eimeria necatrix]CDJ68203.1 glutathione/thioredoxin peroxidase, putative [Eimeria necatrix]